MGFESGACGTSNLEGCHHFSFLGVLHSQVHAFRVFKAAIVIPFFIDNLEDKKLLTLIQDHVVVGKNVKEGVRSFSPHTGG